ncbi:hypothetical protein [Nonomuraea thailandensis]|uniref:hypothetical protein n=1 Tax=Nonomuraea thailandensis TaxID=1188745 RepID=UPI00355792AB
MTVRYLGCFLAGPLEAPDEVLDVVAARLGVDDPSCVKRLHRVGQDAAGTYLGDRQGVRAEGPCLASRSGR